MDPNLEVLQVIQVALFVIPTVYFLALGLMIMLRPVLVLSRRWLLLVFLPLLAANPLAFIEASLRNEVAVVTDWAFWALLGVDLLLAGAVFWLFRGYSVYGLSEAQVREGLVTALRAAGWQVEASQAERKTPLSRAQQVTLLTIRRDGEAESFWLLGRAGEVTIGSRSRMALGRLGPVLAALRAHPDADSTPGRSLGILYLVLGVVFAVLTWIFFFEPRIFVL
ncbi:MAG: hypothetical protein SVR81_02425 [Chloroflexota bacterium]|nr:hypothetical protein [Chloroflexota bacterium]